MKPFLIQKDLDNNALSVTYFKDQYFSRPLHYHPQLELTLITESIGTRFLGNHIESFDDGDLVLIGANVPHVWRNDEFYYKPDSPFFAKAIGVFFDEKLLNKNLLELNEFQGIKNLIKQSKRGIKITGDLRDEISIMIKGLFKLSVPERLITFLNMLHKISISNEITYLMNEPWHYAEKHQDKLNEIYDYLLNNLSRKMNLEEISSKVSFHPVSLGRFIKQHTGKTFVQVLNSMRINYACKLLKDSNSSIPIICNQSGFNNLANFIRQFKEFTGETPLKYRNQFINNFTS